MLQNVLRVVEKKKIPPKCFGETFLKFSTAATYNITIAYKNINVKLLAIKIKKILYLSNFLSLCKTRKNCLIARRLLTTYPQALKINNAAGQFFAAIF